MIVAKTDLGLNDENVWLDIYAPDKTDCFTRDALLVIPGGGYSCICSDREGEPIALDFIQKGYCAFVLHYSVLENARFPKPLIEASLAMKYIKDHAEEYGLNKDRVFATGFSAGGHLCAALGVLWDDKEIYDATGMEYGYNKPAGIIPVYPVISALVPTHMGSFTNICGTENITDEQREKYSLEKHVTKASSPACIIHTSADTTVPVYNALAFAKAYADCGSTFELHIYKDCEHGMALSNPITGYDNPDYKNPHNATWTTLADEWMRSIKTK